jgi:hypothetical protein
VQRLSAGVDAERYRVVINSHHEDLLGLIIFLFGRSDDLV